MNPYCLQIGDLGRASKLATGTVFGLYKMVNSIISKMERFESVYRLNENEYVPYIPPIEDGARDVELHIGFRENAVRLWQTRFEIFN